MIRRYFLYLLLLFAVFSACEPVNRATPVIEALRSEAAPDKRVALWEIEATDGNKPVLRGQTNLPDAHANLLRRLDSLGIAYTDSIRILPDPALPAEWGIVTLSVCNIRSKPRHSAELSTQCTMGQPLRIYEAIGADWFRVQTPDGYFGWLDAGGFRFLPEADLQELRRMEKCIFLPEYGFAHASPQPDARPACDLLRGNILFRIGTQGDYAQLLLPRGDTAFVRSDQIINADEWTDRVTTERDAASLLAEAEKLLGRPYLWGGTSGKGMDCSGFTKEVFARNGLILPRDASQQVHTGREVETDTTWQNLLPGDLLFFGRKATAEKSERITHVAIYLGDGRIIHSAGRVRTESLVAGNPDYAAHRVASFVRARRLLDAPLPLPGAFEPPW